MKRALALILLVPVVAMAAEKITLQGDMRGAKDGDEPTTQPRVVDVRANRVNRCVDARGAVLLSDQPCPTVAGAASAGAAAAAASDPEVVDITALQPRPVREEKVRATAEAPMSNFVRGLLHGSWKLALLVVAIYALYRGVRLARDKYRERYVVDTLQRGPGPVRIR